MIVCYIAWHKWRLSARVYVFIMHHCAEYSAQTPLFINALRLVAKLPAKLKVSIVVSHGLYGIQPLKYIFCWRAQLLVLIQSMKGSSCINTNLQETAALISSMGWAGYPRATNGQSKTLSRLEKFFHFLFISIVFLLPRARISSSFLREQA